MKKTLLLAFVSMFAMQAHAATQDLINSVRSGNVSEVLTLLGNGEDVNGADAGGTTALHYAVASDNAEITQILLSYGADLTVANAKGWTPLKIAEKKELKQVTPILVKYLQLQKQTQDETSKNTVTETVAAVEEVAVQANEVASEAVEKAANEVKNAPVEVKEVVTAVSDTVVNDVKSEVPAAELPEPAKEEKTKENSQVADGDVVELAMQAVVEARGAQTKAEAESKVLADELKQLKAKNAELEAKLAEMNKTETDKAKTSVEAKDKAETKPAPKPVKPVLQKKPVYKAPQPIVKKVELKPSTMVEGIYAGDEEIVYCLDYLGNGENDNLKRAAGYFAASASISEERYKQIVDRANDYFMNSSDKAMTLRDAECSEIITPSNNDKQNQIVRSINKSIGY